MTAPASPNGPLRVGIGGPVGSGKTALMEQLSKELSRSFSDEATTNEIYTVYLYEALTIYVASQCEGATEGVASNSIEKNWVKIV